MSRIGLGRHSRLDDDVGDPLDGLVNLFDVGIVLAVAFLVAGLGLTSAQRRAATESDRRQGGSERSLPNPAAAAPARGRGRAIGQVYRLSDGRLVYVEDGTRP